ncbi:TPA: hypothetical protein QC111_003605 [Bacillus cereus]|uniref:hypothetical protein n=1 Tax=Bacillus cereus group TaxID=86661 RepID=UPI0019279371|nr:hypothetical protein [Bacillus cereus]MBL3878133.1 hypothetical protein [Bacillus cereus]BCD05096.1 hypothetical protein BC30052_2151 [Bacillus cereus]HDR7977702.1 hypothetical protein [Bacillus cereus]HDR8060711.1 hypothetical protein [Bacillus cereus]HDR8078176.1 hypothetical protein [Bacillus cereus]
MLKGRQKNSGRPRIFTDQELKELALDVKNRLGHVHLTYSLLEKETGIGRNTWKRRLEKTITELNKPIYRKIGVNEDDEVYFPNIEQIFEIYKGNTPKIINALYGFETMFIKLYEELHALKKDEQKIIHIKQIAAEKDSQIKKLKVQVEHYKNLYDQLTISSSFPHLQEKTGLTDNLLDFSTNIDKNSSLTNLKSSFKTTNKASTNPIEPTEKNNMKKPINKLQEMFPNFFNEK